MKESFLTLIFHTHKKDADFKITRNTAAANGFRMFAIGDLVYSTEMVGIKLEKEHANMDEAALFRMSNLINE